MKFDGFSEAHNTEHVALSLSLPHALRKVHMFHAGPYLLSQCDSALRCGEQVFYYSDILLTIRQKRIMSEVQERPYEFEMTVVESTRFAFASEAVSGDFSGAMPLEESTGRARACVRAPLNCGSVCGWV